MTTFQIFIKWNHFPLLTNLNFERISFSYFLLPLFANVYSLLYCHLPLSASAHVWVTFTDFCVTQPTHNLLNNLSKAKKDKLQILTFWGQKVNKKEHKNEAVFTVGALNDALLQCNEWMMQWEKYHFTNPHWIFGLTTSPFWERVSPQRGHCQCDLIGLICNCLGSKFT